MVEHELGDEWSKLAPFLGHLPSMVRLSLWADQRATWSEAEAVRLVEMISSRFTAVEAEILPRVANYAFYPVIGVKAIEEGDPVDPGVRLIGLPAGYQLTSLVAAMQCVAFRGMTSQARTRIVLQQLQQDVRLELVTTADDESGPIVAQIIFNLAVLSPRIRSFLIMGDAFSEAIVGNSVQKVPHLVVNGRVHAEGVLDESQVLEHVAMALRQGKATGSRPA
jgi:alkyl hydroperoxide reductase subunit AhpF